MALLLPPKSCMVYTPAPLADAVVRALGDRPDCRWLEPCVGGGAFLHALAKLGVNSNRIIAIDIEQSPRQTDALAQTARGVDFLAWSCTTNHRFDKIVANPPYIALTKLAPALQQSALAIAAPDGQPVSLASNYWYAFVCASLALLRPGGDICFVLPAAWDYADYAAPLRNSIAESFAYFEIHRSSRPMFESVQDGCVILIGRGFSQPIQEAARFEYDSVDALISALQNEQSKSTQGIKDTSIEISLSSSLGDETCQLKDILSIRLGGVTGDAGYFLLTESERRERNLPIKCVRPALSKARHLVSGELTQGEWKRLCDNGERIWLFDPPPSLVKHPAVEAYLGLSPENGGCHRDRYKIRIRNPWYRTPLPRRIDGFISGMSRFGPWICLRAMRRLTATNTLYTIRFHGSLSQDEKAAWSLSLLTSYTRCTLGLIGRVYPDGLVKYEPGDLLNLRVPVPRKVDGARKRYLETIEVLLDGNLEKSQDMAERWFDRA